MKSATLFLLCSCALFASPVQTLKSGDRFPPVVGKSLDDVDRELPAAQEGKRAAIAFGFSEKAGKVVRAWADKLGDDVLLYQVPVLEGVPKIFRGLTERSIRNDTPKARHSRLLLLYREEAEWRTRLGVQDEDTAYLVVLDTSGRVVMRHAGQPEPAILEKVRNALASDALAPRRADHKP